LIQGKNVVGFQQATIKVEREKEFEKLKNAIVRVFTFERVEKFLKRVHSAGCRVRNLEPILANGIKGERGSAGIARETSENLPLLLTRTKAIHGEREI